MIYKDDVVQVYDNYKKRFRSYSSENLRQEDYIKHYCKKFGLSLNAKNQQQLAKIYNEWIMEG